MKVDSLANKAYIEIRRKILSNQLVAGTRLKEDLWAKKMEVNRIAVREALTRLQGEQLIVFGEKGGYFVKSMTADDIREIREIREILELGALRLAIQKIDEQQLGRLEEICNDFTSMVERGYLSGALEADVKFHETLIDCAGNSKLLDIYQISNIPLFHQKIGKTQIHMDDYEQTDQEHRQILKALKEKNLALAQEALTRHLLRGESASLEIE
ncbi:MULTISPECIES: GntR family transcriptional regulator [Spirosoma]|uniref:Transcriptional regulator, GntR family n=1 Tax=Spirosoma linguale (strain ATCC 33905 / DSM 74 / LMG 10896 / Claus 1) TaxID=504472 RepID=D2QG74_SPILD|nr:GntR family transcriptional regulator [Spirosoma sp.]ADB36681.1 transcriptional regulator, GntR family [Spirosoma linguale DSM 74]MCX6217843.1 GntR family transcriptional regulator [Spirosoma sp.]